MVSLLSLRQLAREQNIPIFPYELPETGSMALDLEDGHYCIGLDHHVLETESQERTHLTHELGHCITGSFYNRYATCDVRKRHENRADKWAVCKLIPVDELDRAIDHGLTQFWELAEFFGVTEDLVKKAVCWYTFGNMAAEMYF